MSKKRGNSRFLFLAAIGAVIACVVFFILLLNLDRETARELDDAGDVSAPTADEGEEKPAEWITYTNEEYGFSIDMPGDWKVSENFDEQGSPKFNFYPADTETGLLPFTHHSEQVSHVSVYPHGIPTEGFFGETAPTDVDFAIPVEQERDYVLDSGEHFATLAFSPFGGSNWTASGFLFAHVALEDVAVTCMRGGEEIAAELCDPLVGDTIVRSGTLPPGVRETEVRMLESFIFTSEE